MKILVVGGAGAMASGTVRDLASPLHTRITEIVIADQSIERCRALVAAISDPRLKAMGAVLLATAANDLTLLEVIRERVAEHTRELAASGGNFARAAIVMLAIDGLKMRESLRISAFSAEQREQIVNELLQLAEEAYR